MGTKKEINSSKFKENNADIISALNLRKTKNSKPNFLSLFPHFKIKQSSRSLLALKSPHGCKAIHCNAVTENKDSAYRPTPEDVTHRNKYTQKQSSLYFLLTMYVSTRVPKEHSGKCLQKIISEVDVYVKTRKLNPYSYYNIT